MIEVIVTVLVVAAIVAGIMEFRDKKEDAKTPSTGSGGGAGSGEKVQLESVVDYIVTAPDLDKMTKQKLEEYGRTRGIELDRRKTKSNMLSDLRAHLK